MERIKRQASRVFFLNDGPNPRQGLEEPFLDAVDLEAPPLLVRNESTRAEEEAVT